jgi:hypothetical protein
MTYLQHTSDRCPIEPAAPLFYTLGDGKRRFEERAGNLYWGDDIPEARIISYAPAAPAVDLEAVWQGTVLPLLLSAAKECGDASPPVASA